MTYSSKINIWKDPILHTLFREDMKNRLEGPVVEDLAIDTEFREVDIAFVGGRQIANKHKKLRMPFKLIPNCSQFRMNTTKSD
jgi:hypothetical protein